MGDDKPETKSDEGKITMGDIRKLISEIAGSKTDTKTDDGKKDDEKEGGEPKGIAAIVAAEVQKIRDREAKEAKDKELADRVGALESKKDPEKVPVERGRLHKFMGWGENES